MFYNVSTITEQSRAHWRCIMDYKKEILKLLDKIDDHKLSLIYRFIKGMMG